MKMIKLAVACAIGISALCTGNAFAAQTAIVGGRILPVSSSPLENGVVLIGEDGRITAVGSADTVAVPANARRIDATGMTVYPGLIDSDTSLGVANFDMDIYFGATDVIESSARVFPQGRIIDAFNANHDHLEVVRANGITHAVVAPGDTMSVSGQSALVRLADTGDGHVVRSPLALYVNVSDRARGPGNVPGRMGVASEVRQLFTKARKLLSEKKPAGPADDAVQVMANYLKDGRPIVVTATSSRDVRFALELFREFKFNMILADVLDAEDQLDAVAAAGVPVILGPVQMVPGEGRAYDAIYRLPAALEARKIPFAFSSGGVNQISRFIYPRMAQVRNLPYQAGMSTGYGLGAARALEAITLSPARIWGVDTDLGSIEAGKRASLVIATGNPLEPTTVVSKMLLDGKEVSLESYQSRLRDKYLKPSR